MLALALLLVLPLVVVALWLTDYFVGSFTGRWGAWDAADAATHTVRFAIEILANWN
jgi:hypothetical protein